MSPSGENPGAATRTVLWILHGEEVGGASLSLLRLAPLLEDLGWSPVVWAPRPSALFDEVEGRGLRVRGAPRPFPGYSWEAIKIPPGPARRFGRIPRYYRGLAETIRQTGPCLAHCNSMYTLDEGTVARWLGVPTMFHVHEMIGSSRKHAMARTLIHRVGHLAVGVSQASVDSLSLPSSPAILVREGTDVSVEPPDRSSPNRPLRVGMVGVIARRKGPDVYAEAARLVKAQDSSIEFSLVGAPTDPLDTAWADDVLAMASASGVNWTESADVEARMREWDIFVLPSRVDPFPIVVLEAMAAGLPIVGTSIDGIREQLGDGSGLLVSPDDPEALASAILRLAGDAELRLTLGRSARRRAQARYSLDRQAAGISDAYLDVLDRAASRAS